jgi:glycerophosphoryl diester phosphodiesterase
MLHRQQRFAYPLLLGHRGSRRERSIEENTISAFEFALQQGCDGFEFDVRLTRDREAVVCHDARSRRAFIAESSCAELEHLPTLQSVLSRFGKSAFLDIELKVPGLEEIVLHALHRHAPECGFVISSFLPQVLTDLAACEASVPLGIIFDHQVPRWQKLPVDYLMPEKSLITQELITEAHTAGKKVFTWTVNDKPSMCRFAEWGVDGIISDKPALLVATLRPK